MLVFRLLSQALHTYMHAYVRTYVRTSCYQEGKNATEIIPDAKLPHCLHIFTPETDGASLQDGPHLLDRSFLHLLPTHSRPTAESVQEHQVGTVDEGLRRSQLGAGRVHELHPHQHISDTDQHARHNTEYEGRELQCPSIAIQMLTLASS